MPPSTISSSASSSGASTCRRRDESVRAWRPVVLELTCHRSSTRTWTPPPLRRRTGGPVNLMRFKQVWVLTGSCCRQRYFETRRDDRYTHRQLLTLPRVRRRSGPTPSYLALRNELQTVAGLARWLTTSGPAASPPPETPTQVGPWPSTAERRSTRALRTICAEPSPRTLVPSSDAQRCDIHVGP